MKRFLAILLAFLLPLTASAAVTFPINGGTGSSTLTGIILGAGTSPVQTLQIGNGLQLLSGILSSTGVTTFGTTSISATSPLIWNTSTANMSIQVANTSQNGYLSSTDWNTFNNKQPAGTYVTSVTGTANQITSSGSTAITLSLPNHVIFPTDYVASAGSTTNATTTNFAITGAAANCNGTSALTTTSSGVVGCTTQPQGTVTAVSVASTNGFAGTSSGGATPALTLTTSITGVLKGNGTAITAASNGTDYSLITALTCSAGQFFQQATAAGVFTCGTPTGTNYTGTFPIVVTGSVISSLFSTTSNSGMAQGFQYVGSSGIFQTAASSSLFGYTPLNPTRNVNTTAPLTGGGALTSDLTLGCASCSTFAFPFTSTSYGNATGTLIGFTNGILVVGSSTIVGNATTTGMHAFGNVRIPTLGVAAGQFAAFDPNGVLIGTTTPINTGGSSEGVQWATAAVLGGTPTYSNGTAGVGATLTEVGTGALAIDGNNPVSGDRVLVKNQASAFQNGIYTVTVTGSGIASYVLTRSTDYNSSTEITPGLTTYVVSGSANLDTNWAVNFTVPLTMGTTNLNYTEVSGGGAAVTSVSNSDSTLTITPTTGNVVGSLNLAHANVWNALQTFGNATSSLFSTTYGSTTNAFIGTLTLSTTTAGCLNTSSGGAVYASTCSSGGSSFPFTPTTNFTVNTSATSTPIWARLGLFASSTSVIGTTTFASNGFVGFGTSTPEAPVTFAQTGGLLQPDLIIDGVNGLTGAEMELNRGSNTGTEEANIDFNTNGTEFWQLGMQNNSSNDFELWDGSDDPAFTIKTGTNAIGFGTTTPFGDFAINADFGDAPGLIFNVASSSQNATTSVFAVSSSGQSEYAAGTANSPAITFIQDLASGIYQAVSGTLSFVTAGTEKMRLLANGNFGVGTTTPQWLTNFASSTVAQLALSSTGTNGNSHWVFNNIFGNLFLATSSPTTFATSTNSDPNTGYIEFPNNGGCIGCADILFAGGINLRNAKYVSATSSNPTANVIQDIYTAPAGRRALFMGAELTNGSAGTVNWSIRLKLGGSYYQDTGTSTITTGTSNGTGFVYILEPGESISILQDTTSSLVTAWFQIVEFDASVPFKSVKLTSVSSGTTTLYTAPTGVTTLVTGAGPTVAGGATVKCSNVTALTIAEKTFIVSNGQTATDGLNAAGVQQTCVTGVGANQVTVNQGSNLGEILNNSASLQFWINNPLALIWINVYEH